jgi:Putative zinc-finger
MSEREQNKPLGESARVLRCDEWENLLADALDGTLSAADTAAFTRHHRECVQCAQMLKETEQGRSWMKYLAEEPEVPADLLQKILARTSGGLQPGVAIPAISLPARPAWHRIMLPAVRQVMEPRLMMTVAMAFFSIALTLNLAGVKLTDLRAADFQPSRLRATITRQYYSTNEQVTKYYKNLRLVYEMESRVRELRRTTDTEPAPSPQQTPKPPARDGSGSPSSSVPKGQEVPPATDNRPRQSRRNAPPAEMVPAGFQPSGRSGELQKEVFRVLPSATEDQTRIYCHAALDIAPYAAFVTERRMRFANATKLHRKSGQAQRSLV